MFETSRELPAPSADVFAAIADPERLARWWGPAGFTNTFEECEVRTGGRWVYTMHGPDGKHYPNESQFAEVTPSRVVIDHISLPRFQLTISLEPTNGGTCVHWRQAFEKPEVAAAIRGIVVPSNEQNLDRLTAEVAAGRRAA